MNTRQALREQLHALWATAGCFLVGATLGFIMLQGAPSAFIGTGSIAVKTAIISAAVASLAFIISTVFYRRDETWHMPRWQKLVSNVSAIAVTLAMGGVTAIGVLLAGQVLATGLQGLELGPIGGGVLSGVAAALSGRLSFQAGIHLSTKNLSALLFSYLIIGTVFAMTTATDPTWWERNFSQLGAGSGAWAFNGTLIIAGLLIATVGSYIGRDLHRLLDDVAIPRIATVVIIWFAAGIALTAVGFLPIDQIPVPHNIVAFASLMLLIAAAGYTQFALPDPPLVLKVVTTLLVIVVGISAVLTFLFSVISVTALESIVVGLALLWMTTFIRVLGILTPDASLASRRRRLVPRTVFTRRLSRGHKKPV
ncbi:MAG: DUF998 domain-containing protein [Yaniella sp.]